MGGTPPSGCDRWTALLTWRRRSGAGLYAGDPVRPPVGGVQAPGAVGHAAAGAAARGSIDVVDPPGRDAATRGMAGADVAAARPAVVVVRRVQADGGALHGHSR